MRINKSACALLLCLIAQPAMADWQNTHWGMSKDEFVSTAAKTVGNPEVALDVFGVQILRSSFETDGFNFDGTFGFKSGHFQFVNLILSDPGKDSCMRLRDAMLNRYGNVEPISKEIHVPFSSFAVKVNAYSWDTMADKISFIWMPAADDQPEFCGATYNDPEKQ